MKIAVLGLGYVGTVTAAGLASCGHQVVGVDVEAAKVERVIRGESPVVEPGLPELIRQGVDSGRLEATTDICQALEGCDVTLLCVGTPSASSGATDLVYVERAVADIRRAMTQASPPVSGHHTVVIRSTVPPGTVRRLVDAAFETDPPVGWTVASAMCPEFLREGSGVEDFFAPAMVVIGTADEQAKTTLTDLFTFVDVPPAYVSLETAESVKYASNAFHATKVAFANEMARVLRPYGVDSREVMEVFCQDTKLNISPMYLRPGFAFGGSCLPKDLRALRHLARVNEVDVPLLHGVAFSNELVVRDVLERILAHDGRRVALLGLSFKMDTDDLRESPYVELAERLLGKGYAVRIYDPIINPDRLVGDNLRQIEARLPHLNRLLTRSPAEALDGVDVAIVGSGDPDMLAALAAQPPARVIDLYGRAGARIEALPEYEGVGW